MFLSTGLPGGRDLLRNTHLSANRTSLGRGVLGILPWRYP